VVQVQTGMVTRVLIEEKLVRAPMTHETPRLLQKQTVALSLPPAAGLRSRARKGIPMATDHGFGSGTHELKRSCNQKKRSHLGPTPEALSVVKVVAGANAGGEGYVLERRHGLTHVQTVIEEGFGTLFAFSRQASSCTRTLLASRSLSMLPRPHVHPGPPNEHVWSQPKSTFRPPLLRP
jgi:hypothetical protein